MAPVVAAVATVAPAVTVAPVATLAPAEATLAPVPTVEPVAAATLAPATVAPEATVAPDATVAPEATLAPVATVAPAVTVAPATVAPVASATRAPAATVAPVASATLAPAATVAPAATLAPAGTLAPMATVAPLAGGLVAVFWKLGRPLWRPSPRTRSVAQRRLPWWVKKLTLPRLGNVEASGSVGPAQDVSQKAWKASLGSDLGKRCWPQAGMDAADLKKLAGANTSTQASWMHWPAGWDLHVSACSEDHVDPWHVSRLSSRPVQVRLTIF